MSTVDRSVPLATQHSFGHAGWTDLLFYGVMATLLVLSITKTLSTFLPSGVATQVGHNSEAYLMVILLGALLQWGRPWARATARPWLPLAVVGVVAIAIGITLGQNKDALPSTVSTLNEAFAAVGVICLYLILRRPVAAAPYLALALLAFIIAFNRTDFVTLQAESLVAIMLAPVSLDVADPPLVDSEASERPAARWIWCAVIIAALVVFALLSRMHLGGLPAEIARYGSRPTEAFLAFLSLHLYFWYRRRSVAGAAAS